MTNSKTGEQEQKELVFSKDKGSQTTNLSLEVTKESENEIHRLEIEYGEMLVFQRLLDVSEFMNRFSTLCRLCSAGMHWRAGESPKKT